MWQSRLLVPLNFHRWHDLAGEIAEAGVIVANIDKPTDVKGCRRYHHDCSHYQRKLQ